MSDLCEVTVHNGSISEKRAYIYLIYSEEFDVVYVGQTYNSRGALARLSQHLSHGSGNQFRKRLKDLVDHDYISLNRVYFAAFPLVGKEKYEIESYRIAVEFNTFKNILNRIGKSNIHPAVISNNSSSSHNDLDFIERQSFRVTNILFDWLRNKARPQTESHGQHS